MQELNDFSSKRAKWDFLKYQVKNVAIRESKKRAKERNREYSRLENDIVLVKRIFGDGPRFVEDMILRLLSSWPCLFIFF